MKLLTRKQFRDVCFKRDKYKCLLCGLAATYDENGVVNNLDCHHLVERRLWIDGGFYEENGVTLCDPDCHMKAEQTIVSCEELREKAGIKTILLPSQFCEGEKIDKWGNPILPNGMRIKGELFNNCQEILAPVLHLFSDRIKFPRTFHLEWSPGKSKDDRTIENLKAFENKEVIITAKMDGENSTLYKDYLHARSISYDPHPSRNMLKQLHAEIKNEIPNGYRICGENLYAKHSIYYENLPAYFLVFNIWNEKNMALSWDETKEWAELLGLKTVPELYRGKWDEKLIKALKVEDNQEGYVVRIVSEIAYHQYRTHVAKWVSKEFSKTIKNNNLHWKSSKITPNGLKI